MKNIFSTTLVLFVCIIASNAVAAEDNSPATMVVEAWVKERMEKCGDDFNAVRVGMTLARIKECTGIFKKVGVTKDANAKAEIYNRGRLYITVVDGKIARYTELR